MHCCNTFYAAFPLKADQKHSFLFPHFGIHFLFFFRIENIYLNLGGAQTTMINTMVAFTVTLLHSPFVKATLEAYESAAGKSAASFLFRRRRRNAFCLNQSWAVSVHASKISKFKWAPNKQDPIPNHSWNLVFET